MTNSCYIWWQGKFCFSCKCCNLLHTLAKWWKCRTILRATNNISCTALLFFKTFCTTKMSSLNIESFIVNASMGRSAVSYAIAHHSAILPLPWAARLNVNVGRQSKALPPDTTLGGERSTVCACAVCSHIVLENITQPDRLNKHVWLCDILEQCQGRHCQHNPGQGPHLNVCPCSFGDGFPRNDSGYKHSEMADLLHFRYFIRLWA